MKYKKIKKSGQLTSRSLSIVHENGFPKVTDVVDADEPIEAEVTSNDVSMGTRKEHRVCPYATACKRKTRCPVIIARTVSYVIMGTTAVRYFNTMALQRQIAAYDQGGVFEVGVYEMAPFPESHRIGAQHYGSGTSGNGNGGKKKKRRRRHFSTNVRTVLGAYKPAEVLR